MDTVEENKKIELLLARCRKKENSAFKELYGQYAKAMFNISLRIVNNKDEAEDILQESFVKAFNDMSRFNSAPEFSAWIKRVVVNHSLDVVRKQKNNFISIDDTDVAAPEEAQEEISYDIKTVSECLRELPDGYRAILTLFLFENYSHKEIGATLNISEGTSKSQYNRARLKLAALIQQKTFTYEQS